MTDIVAVARRGRSARSAPILAVLALVAGAASAADKPAFPAEFDELGVERGADDAPLTIREFADYQCPACKSMKPTMDKILEEYVDSGDVRFVYFDFPLRGMHDNAQQAAEAARCAGEQGDYWAMHDTLFEQQEGWSDRDDPVPQFREYANGADLDGGKLAECVSDDRMETAVDESHQVGQKIGVAATPSLIIGDAAFRGALPHNEIKRIVERELAERTGDDGE